MTYDLTVRKERKKGMLSRSDGTEFLSYTVDTPRIEGIKSFNDFYADIQTSCVDFCEKRLPSRCVQGRFYSYRLTYKAHAQNQILTVTLKVTLSDKTTATLVSGHTETHKWNFDKSQLRVFKK